MGCLGRSRVFLGRLCGRQVLNPSDPVRNYDVRIQLKPYGACYRQVRQTIRFVARAR